MAAEAGARAGDGTAASTPAASSDTTASADTTASGAGSAAARAGAAAERAATSFARNCATGSDEGPAPISNWMAKPSGYFRAPRSPP